MDRLTSVAVAGLGSMGRRRLALLRELLPEASFFGVDGRADRRQSLERENLRCWSSLEVLLDEVVPQVLFLCTSPLSHGDLALMGLEKGCHLFCELNLDASWYEEAQSMAAQRGLSLFFSSTFLYRSETRRIVSEASSCSPSAYRYHVGQFLPDWHPWESYRDFFVAQQASNGCRELLAIELPWLCRAFGPLERFSVERASLTSLDLAYPDTLSLLLRHESGTTGSLVVDVVSRRAMRSFRLWGEWGDLLWEGYPESLIRRDGATGKESPLMESGGQWRQDCRYSPMIVEDAYRNEVEAFLDLLKGRQPTVVPYGVDEDRQILAWIDRIEGRSS